MRLSVELKGLARRVSRAKEVMVEVSNGATLGDAVVAHRDRSPVFLGSLEVREGPDFADAAPPGMWM